MMSSIDDRWRRDINAMDQMVRQHPDWSDRRIIAYTARRCGLHYAKAWVPAVKAWRTSTVPVFTSHRDIVWWGYRTAMLGGWYAEAVAQVSRYADYFEDHAPVEAVVLAESVAWAGADRYGQRTGVTIRTPNDFAAVLRGGPVPVFEAA